MFFGFGALVLIINYLILGVPLDRNHFPFSHRNISKNTTIIIPAHNIPSFKPAKVFIDAVKTKVQVK